MIDNTIQHPTKPNFVKFDSCEKANNYIDELENMPIDKGDLIDIPITIHHMPSMQMWLLKAIRKWKMNSDEDRMMRFVLTARIMQASHKDILKHFGIKITKNSLSMIRGQERLAKQKVKDILAKDKYGGGILIPGNENKFKETPKLAL